MRTCECLETTESLEDIHLAGHIWLACLCFVFQSPPVFEGSSIPVTSRRLPLINLLITVISDSFHHYRFFVPHTACLCTQPDLEENFAHAHTHKHTHTHTQGNAERPGCWSHTPPPSPRQSAIHHRATGERERRREGRERKNRRVRQRKEWPRLSFYLELGLS